MTRVYTFNWIKSVIRSCNSMSQLYTCSKLIEQYGKRYTDRELEIKLLKEEKNLHLNKLCIDGRCK